MTEIIAYLSDPGVWISFLTLSLLEIVLGIDNVIFIAIVANRLGEPARARARALGLLLAFFMRVAFLVSIVWLVGKTHPIYSYRGFHLSWRDVILGLGGLFLLYKATIEIGSEMRTGSGAGPGFTAAAFYLIVTQIVLLDLVFSIDSIITAVGLSRQLPVMIAAVVVAILVMLLASGPVGNFIQRHPTIKILALAFLLLVGFALVADAFHHHIHRLYLYVSIGFALAVELAMLIAHAQRKGLVLAIYAFSAVLLAAIVHYVKMVHPETTWNVFLVPAGFGLVVQFLNLATRRAAARAEAAMHAGSEKP
jgi:predicted tellurium resistance membrane protein TerC